MSSWACLLLNLHINKLQRQPAYSLAGYLEAVSHLCTSEIVMYYVRKGSIESVLRTVVVDWTVHGILSCLTTCLTQGYPKTRSCKTSGSWLWDEMVYCSWGGPRSAVTTSSHRTLTDRMGLIHFYKCVKNMDLYFFYVSAVQSTNNLLPSLQKQKACNSLQSWKLTKLFFLTALNWSEDTMHLLFTE